MNALQGAARAPRRREFRHRTGQWTATMLACTWVMVASAAGQARKLPDRVVVERSSTSGQATLITSADGGALVVSTRAGAAEVDPIDVFVEYGEIFGITRPAEQLRLHQARVDELGSRHTTYQQVHAGVRVFSGELRVHQDADGGVIAANGRFHGDLEKVNTTAALTEEAAMDYAAAVMPGVNQPVGNAELVIVDPGWYGDAPRGPHLAYYLELGSTDGVDVEAFFISASTGEVLDHWSKVCTVRQRKIYNGDSYEFPGTLSRAEGDPSSPAHVDVDRAYDYYGDVYDYYWRAFGRDSIDDDGMPLVATVNSQLTGCPNAAWIGSYHQMIFCPGMVTDDIVAHELTHGVTEHTANLIYQNQSGQLNEAFSDIFGELVDLFNGNAAFLGQTGGPTWPAHPTDTGADAPNTGRNACSHYPAYSDGVRWMLGEDVTAASQYGDAIRDMWNPLCLGDPDKASSLYQNCSHWDSGGVHSGSGVLNHGFALATDGGTFNGETVVGVGPIKSGAVFYRALTMYLTSVSDFEDTYHLLNQAAADLVGTWPKDPRTGQLSGSMFSHADADRIDQALQAVELNSAGSCGVMLLLDAAAPPVCNGRVTIFADNFDGGATAWQADIYPSSSSALPWRRQSGLPDGRIGTAWFAPNDDSPCDGSDATGLRRLVSPTITLPVKLDFPALRFTHLVQSESYWDGANVKLRRAGGEWKTIPASAFVYNPYNVRTLYQGSTNPMAGEPAFSGHAGQWGTSIVDLRGLVEPGQMIQLRFDFGQDECGGLVGWYLDDVEIYDCAGTTDCNGNGIADSAELATGPRPDLIVDQPHAHAGVVRLGAKYNGFHYYEMADGRSFAENFQLTRPKAISTVRIWGGYDNGVAGGDDFHVNFRKVASTGYPDAAVIAGAYAVHATWTSTGVIFGVPIYEVALQLDAPPTLEPGSYYVEIYQTTTQHGDFFWEVGNYHQNQYGYYYFVLSDTAPGQVWDAEFYSNLALRIEAGMLGENCNHNALPDECESEADCNHNQLRDICESAAGSAPDCNDDGILDVCDTDCNHNTIPDGCDIEAGTEADCNANSVPDSCEPFNDCNSNGIQDICEGDCNHNSIADACDIASGASSDCNQNKQPDECEWPTDCNDNNVIDLCDIAAGLTDCDGNRLPDVCQIDFDLDGLIDSCDQCPADPLKTSPGACGCGSLENDTDADGTPDCIDKCDSDPAKKEPGQCGCGKSDVDTDKDGVADCRDVCTNGNDKIDTDKDGVPDCADECPKDKNETKAGQCGCGKIEVDPDGDTVADCIDNCPLHANLEQVDTDGDGLGDMCDGCPEDADKSAPGICGCGSVDLDSDGDDLYDCADPCPANPTANNSDSDGDGVGDECEDCPLDPNKTVPGICGCGRSDIDGDADGVPNCIDVCSGTPAGATVDATGCPVSQSPPPQPTPAPDTDGDGVADDVDECADTPADTAVDEVGCPVGATPDPGGTSDPACGTMGAVSMILLGLGLVGIRQRMR